MTRISEGSSHSAIVDYDLHGLAGIRLLDAMPADTMVLERQLGRWRSSLTREPDIFVRFVDRLRTSSSLRHIGLNDAGFTDDAFVVLKKEHNKHFKMQISFSPLNGVFTIICERGLSTIPLMIPVLNLVMVSKGVVPLHASAFVFNGTGVLTTGWAKGGKTELLLAFAAHGATYVGDEWVYLASDGRTMYGFPLPITMRDWHFAELPQYWNLLAPSARRRLQAIKLLNRGVTLPSRVLKYSSLVGRVTQQFNSLLQHFEYASVPPDKLFGQTGSMVARPDKVFFVMSHDSPEISVQPAEPEHVASRMLYSLQYERMHLMSYYLKFRFAFPDNDNALFERVQSFEKTALPKALAGKEAYTVTHPYPVSMSSLYDAVRPHVVSEA